MNISERLKQMQSDQDKYPLTLPGLDENNNDLVVYFTKLTVKEDEKLRKKHPTFYKSMTDGDIPSFSAMVDLIILKCKDEDGNAIFAQADSMYLANQDVGYITAIATGMLEKLFDIPTVETIEGN